MRTIPQWISDLKGHGSKGCGCSGKAKQKLKLAIVATQVKKEEMDTLEAMLNSSDRENWLVLLTILDEKLPEFFRKGPTPITKLEKNHSNINVQG